MATGASTADLAIILIDAHCQPEVLPRSPGVMLLSRILLGIRHFVVAINKMDLVGLTDQTVYDAIQKEFTGFLHRIGGPLAQFIPISALRTAITWLLPLKRPLVQGSGSFGISGGTCR